jgi:hypothetical protein
MATTDPAPMKTDHPIYLFLRSGPEAFRVLTGGLVLEGTYKACSLTIKGIEFLPGSGSA